MSERHSLAWAGDVLPAVGTCASRMGGFLSGLLTVSMLCQASARQISVPAQTVSPFADTEVSTNVVLQTVRTDVREVNLHLRFEAEPANDLEVAFGRDVNTNGALDVSEIETVYGWRGGRHFIENVREWNRIEANEPQSGRKDPVDFNVQLKNGCNCTPALFTAICGAERAFLDFEKHPPAWLFRREWNMMRIVRRGAGPMSEWVRCTVNHGLFYLHLR